jgi:ubiquinone/menaquinone biosynthesis C-methylase UbiE
VRRFTDGVRSSAVAAGSMTTAPGVTLHHMSECAGRNAGSPRAPSDRIIDFFDRRAPEYDREYGEQTPAGYALRVRRRKVLELFDRPDGNVLDVGCGPGVMAEQMLARRCRFWGIDPSENMIGIARARFRDRADARFLLGDATGLPFTDAFFDAVLCMGVIDSVLDGDRAVHEMVRVLKPGGTLILSVPNLLSPYAWWKNYGYYPALAMWHRLRARLGDPRMLAGGMRDCPRRTL